MATVRNIAGEDRFIPIVNHVVADDATFEVDDDVFDSVTFSPEIFKIIEAPHKSKPAKKAVSKKEEE